MDGQMDRQLSLYPLTCMCCWNGVGTPSIWLKISLDPLLLLFSGEKTPLKCAEWDTGALEVVACKNARGMCVCKMGLPSALPRRGSTAQRGEAIGKHRALHTAGSFIEQL